MWCEKGDHAFTRGAKIFWIMLQEVHVAVCTNQTMKRYQDALCGFFHISTLLDIKQRHAVEEDICHDSPLRKACTSTNVFNKSQF